MSKIHTLAMSGMMAMVAAALSGCAVGADDLEGAGLDEEAVGEEQAALTTAETTFASRLSSIESAAPTALPASTPDSLLTVSYVDHSTGLTKTVNLRDLIAAGCSGKLPCAKIREAYHTVATPSAPPTLIGTSAPPTYQTGAVPAQLYECRANATGGGYGWGFVRPEAGLAPITTAAVSTSGVTLDHFRYPGDAATPAGPAWRVSYAQEGLQEAFVGAVDVTVANGTESIPLLRVRNVGLPRNISAIHFPETSSSSNNMGFVLRLNTVCGLAPTTGCGASTDVGKTFRSLYLADYYFVELYT